MLQVEGCNPALRHSEDVDLILRLAAAGHQGDWIHEPLVRYRIHSGNASGRLEPQLKGLLSVIDHHLNTLPNPHAVCSKDNTVVAKFTKDFMDEEQKILTEFGGDPLLKLKSRELDIKARADEAKRAYDEGRISLDTMRAMQNQEQFEDKQEQNEELAELRADTSLTKQVMSADAALERQQMADRSKRHDFGRNFKKN